MARKLLSLSLKDCPAAFLDAMAALSLDEGREFSNHPWDEGRATKHGISQAQYPSLDIASLTFEQATWLYFEDYWKPSGVSLLANRQLRLKLFSFNVLAGPKATMWLQRALNKLGSKLLVDGQIGTKTAHEANSYRHQAALMAVFKLQAMNFIFNHVAIDPDDASFLNGWLNRLERSY